MIEQPGSHVPSQKGKPLSDFKGIYVACHGAMNSGHRSKLLRLMRSIDITRLHLLDVCKWANFATLRNEFERLVHTYQTYLQLLAYEILEDWHTAEDIVQEAWTKAFASLKKQWERGKVIDMSHIRGFLGVIVRNTAYTYSTRQHHFNRVPLEAANGEGIGKLEAVEADKFEQGEFHLIQKEGRRILGELLRGLPLRYRRVILLRFFQDYSYEETAKELQCSVGTVKCYQHRGLEQLQQAVKDRGILRDDFDVWNDYSRCDSFLWDHVMRNKG